MDDALWTLEESRSNDSEQNLLNTCRGLKFIRFTVYLWYRADRHGADIYPKWSGGLTSSLVGQCKYHIRHTGDT